MFIFHGKQRELLKGRLFLCTCNVANEVKIRENKN